MVPPSMLRPRPRPGTVPGTRFLAALCVLLPCALGAAPAAAQAVRATVVDAATSAPVAEAFVRVEREDGSLAGATFTRVDGTAVVRLREGGPYRVVVERGGYERMAQPLAVGPRGTVDVRLRMTQRPFAMDTVQVIARSRNERVRDGFERRRQMHDGVFLDSAYLRQRRATHVANFLAEVPGITLWAGDNGPQPRSTRGWRCMVTLLDGRPATREIYPTEVVAVEVYREAREVPPEFRIHIIPENTMEPCGVYAYWTRARW